jgi:hypothetical protein
MKNKRKQNKPSPVKGIAYRIVVKGTLSGNYSDRLAGMRITTTSRWDEPTLTTLEGPVRDQGTLMGVLNTLYELHLPILQVETPEEGGSNS